MVLYTELLLNLKEIDMNNLTEILTIEEYNRVINDQVIMVFSTTWCPDCHFLKTFIDELVNDNPTASFQVSGQY